MDRSVVEGNPHAVIEGMIIGAYAIGAPYGYVYIRAEYPLAVERLHLAIKQAKERGFLGKNILGKGFDFMIKVKLGAGAFVCGEETALIASIEGKRGQPQGQAAVPGPEGTVGISHDHQQRGNACECAVHHAQGRRLVRGHGHGEEQRAPRSSRSPARS